MSLIFGKRVDPRVPRKAETNVPPPVFQTLLLQWFRVQGRPRIGAAIMYNDLGLVGKFQKWMGETGIRPVATMVAGRSLWVGGFLPEHASRVLQWLSTNGAEETDDLYGTE